jgi:VanZ family protein
MELLTRKAWWLLTATWAVIIFDLSRASYSSACSARFISIVLDWLSISILSRNLGLLNNLLRKSAHLTEYAVLAVFLYNALKPVGNPYWSRKAACWALLASGSYSITDELHQLFVLGRHASLFDCLIDTTGAFLGLFVLSAAIVILQRKPTSVVAKTAQAFHEMG